MNPNARIGLHNFPPKLFSWDQIWLLSLWTEWQYAGCVWVRTILACTKQSLDGLHFIQMGGLVVYSGCCFISGELQAGWCHEDIETQTTCQADSELHWHVNSGKPFQDFCLLQTSSDVKLNIHEECSSFCLKISTSQNITIWTGTGVSEWVCAIFAP